MAAIGHGRFAELDTEAAIAAARDSEPDVREDVAPESGFTAGQQVLVSQEGTQDPPSAGRLAVLTNRRVTILREHPEVGTVAVHFPRIGQIVRPG